MKQNPVTSRIAQLRDERNWSNNHLALESGVGASTILNWYKSNATPQIDAIQSLCNAFGITMSEFFNESNESVHLSGVQKEFLSEFDSLTNEEKQGLLHLLKSINQTHKRFQKL